MQAAWDEAQSRLPALRNAVASLPSMSRSVQRVGQLDADQLDQDLAHMLKEPFAKALSLVDSALSFKIEPELTLIIHSILYKHSVWDTGATHGAQLQGLRFAHPNNTEGKLVTPSRLLRRTVYAHALLTVALPYLHTRARTLALSRAWPDAPLTHYRRKLWEAMSFAENVHGILALLGFCMFLRNGRYRTLVDRILGLRLVPIQQITSRSVSYEFMNRQMVWHAFTEFLLFLLPLVNVRILRRRLGAIISHISLASILPTRLQQRLSLTGKTSSTILRRAKYADLPEDQCAICVESASFKIADLARTAVPAEQDHRIHTPYIASCGHVYCYFCLAQSLLRAADDGERGWECLRCTKLVTDANRATVLTDVHDDSGSLDSLDVDGISLDSYDSLRPRSRLSHSTISD